jgi:hypothetical protein
MISKVLNSKPEFRISNHYVKFHRSPDLTFEPLNTRWKSNVYCFQVTGTGI